MVSGLKRPKVDALGGVMSSKYSDLTTNDVRRLINKGEYTVELIELVRDKGAIVRHLEATEISPLPGSIVSYNVYNQIIQEINLDGVIRAIAEDRNRAMSESLSIQYGNILNNLAYYRDNGDRLDGLNSKSLDAISPFEFGSMKGLGSLNDFWFDPDDTVRTVDSYVNVLFVYIMSGYWLHGQGFSVDTTSTNKIESLESAVREIYQKLLIDYDGPGEPDKVALINSVYAYVYLEREVDTKIIEDLVVHDGRCDTPVDFFESFSKLCLEKKWNNGRDRYEYEAVDNYRKNAAGRLKYATKLHDILTKIENVKGIIPQLHAAGEIDEASLKLGAGFVRSPLSVIRVSAQSATPLIGSDN
ncbi:hypothetical protein SAMN05216247_103280 [Pseudomonas salomonii]|uniref:Uncharacterized protein n=2 Tax=Pseudomonas salomonii TaxID=191391 RepID=A0A1H3IJG5_9PSED|nr:hypothetical protein SAMN05216247_103280 [Pseudomonas salomonii]